MFWSAFCKSGGNAGYPSSASGGGFDDEAVFDSRYHAVALGLCWIAEARRPKVNDENALKIWAFDEPMRVLETRTGIRMRIAQGAIVVTYPNGNIETVADGSKAR